MLLINVIQKFTYPNIQSQRFFRSVFELIMLLLKQTKKDLTFSIFHIFKLSAGQYFTTTWDGRTVYSSRNVIVKVRNINAHAF